MERAKELKVNAGIEPGTDIGPLTSKEVSCHSHIDFTFLKFRIYRIPFAIIRTSPGWSCKN